MIIVVKKGASQEEVREIVSKIEASGLKAHVSKGEERTIIGAIGDERKLNVTQLEALNGIEKVMPVVKPYKVASREFHPEDTVIDVEGVKIGGKELAIWGGPCSVESEEQVFAIAEAVKKAGVKLFRGSVYKPRTSPYDFQGMGDKGLKILKKVKDELGLVIETEVMDIRKVEIAAKYVDLLRVGARNMQNFDLLKEVGKINKPVILKNGLSSTIKEFLMSAEYIMSEGNHKVILCERGIRTFETETRFTLDLSAVPVIKGLTHLPIIVDPSHAAGRRDIVGALSKAAVAAGADGLLIEVHNAPEKAMCDGKQSVTTNDFPAMLGEIGKVATAVGRAIPK